MKKDSCPTRLIVNEEIYDLVIKKEIPEAKRFVWIATADLKDMHVEEGGRFVPMLKVLAGLIRRGVEIRLIHAKEPGPRFRKDFDRFKEFIGSDLFERVLCPRVHFKAIIIDGKSAYTGSANFTGAGMGGRGTHRRNFESGVYSRDPEFIRELMNYFDGIFLGEFCGECGIRNLCPDPIT